MDLSGRTLGGYVVGRPRGQDVRPALRLRQVTNVVNLSTPLGLLLAAAARTRLERAADGLLVAWGYRWPVPKAPAFTVGNVILVRLDEETLAARPRLMAHEGRHATQYAVCFGPLLLPLYLLAGAWSWWRTRDVAARNVFERLAGLEDGGYRAPADRP